MKQNTRDWLLEKLVFADRETMDLLRSKDALHAENERLRTELRDVSEEHVADTQHLVERIQRMAPEKQFRVLFNSPSGGEWMSVLAVASANGVTTITVEREVAGS